MNVTHRHWTQSWARRLESQLHSSTVHLNTTHLSTLMYPKWPLPFTSRNNCLSIQHFNACCKPFPSQPHFSAQIIHYGYKLWHSTICNFLHPPTPPSYGHVSSPTPDFWDTLNFILFPWVGSNSLNFAPIQNKSKLAVWHILHFRLSYIRKTYYTNREWIEKKKEYVHLYLITTPSTQQRLWTRTV